MARAARDECVTARDTPGEAQEGRSTGMVFRRSGRGAAAGQGPDVPAGYADVQLIARGGFAVVYRAHDERFDRTVALKVLTLDGLDERILRRFRAECMATGRVSAHPHIVTVYDAGTTPGQRPWLSMEHCSGGSVADRLERDGAMPVAEVLDAGLKLASALQAAHGAGILHRDVKPQNVLVTAYGEPALADFGIARVTTEGDAMTQTAAFTVVHSAPEILEGADASAASDVYSLASTLYAMLAGRAAYDREASIGLAPLVTRILRGDVPALARDDLPPGLDDLLRTALSADPARRPQSAAELAGGLAACAARTGGPGRTAPAAPPAAPAPPAPVGPPSHPDAPDAAPHDAPPATHDPAVAARAEQLASGLAAAGVTDAASTHAVGTGRPDTPASAGLPAPGPRPTSLTGPARPAGQADLTHRREDLDGLDAAVGRAGGAPAPARPRPRRGRTLPALLVLAAVAVVGTVAGVVWGLAGRDEPTPGPDPTTTATASRATDAAESAPRDLTVRASEGRLEVSWTMPDASVTPFLDVQPQAGDSLQLDPGEDRVTLVDVEAGQQYCFRVTGLVKLADGTYETYPYEGEPVCATPL